MRITKIFQYQQKSPPRTFLLMAIAAAIGVFIPLGYLAIRAFQADPKDLSEFVFRKRNAYLLGNTLLLSVSVLLASSCIAFPMAWLTSRTRLAGRKLFTLLGVMPLAIPSYLMAYAYLSLGGNIGLVAKVFGYHIERFSGFSGALLALTFYNFPYLFLNLYAALRGIDPSQEESARALGYSPWKVFWKITFPQLRPAFAAGGILIMLHVFGDFGVVSLMRYETLSYSLFSLYKSGNIAYASWISLILVVLAGIVVYIEAKLLRSLQLQRAGKGSKRKFQLVSLGAWTIPSYLFLIIISLMSVVIPLITILYWFFQERGMTINLQESLLSALQISFAAAILATSWAIAIAYVSIRFATRAAKILEKLSYIGYAIPALAFGLALIVLFRGTIVYQTSALLIYALTIHFLAEALGPIRSAMYQNSPRLEESAKALGCNNFQVFFRVTLPLLRNAALASASFVFLSTMKELPLTYMLSPLGFRTLAVNTFDTIEEAMFPEAAPYALLILLFSASFVGVLLYYEQQQKTCDH